MTNANDDAIDLRAALTGDANALGQLVALHRDRLKRMVRLRMDPRLAGRIDESDVLQEVYLEVQQRFPDYARDQGMPFFLWLRFLTAQRLTIMHRRHIGAAMRGADREVSLNQAVGPAASSTSLAQFLLGRSAGISKAAMRTELQTQLEEALQQLDPLDREVLVLRHFEELSNNEVAAVLGIQKTAASNRYVRALKRLRSVLERIPGLLVD